MLFSATILALVLGTAVSAPWYQEYGAQRSPRHQTGLNPDPLWWQGNRNSLTQGFLCDWCVVGVEDAQAAVKESLDTIMGVLNRTAQLCQFCPVQDQCYNFFTNEIPEAIMDFLAEVPNDICNEFGVCDENASLPGMVMNNLNENIARDRVIKRMLMRARVTQQKMIRLLLGPDYLCTACQDFMTASREILLDNETQHEIVEFLTPLCNYLPSVYQAECTELVQTLPALMTMVATEVLTDSTCSELGFCNQTKETSEVPDIFSQLGLDRILPSVFNGQSPFQRPGQNPFQFPGGNPESRPGQYPYGRPGQAKPGQKPYGIPSRPELSRPGQNPYGIPSRPELSRPGQNPFGFPDRLGQSRPGQNPFGIPSLPGQIRPENPFQFPSQSRPRPQSPIGKWPSNSRPSVVRPQKPKTTTKPTTPEPELEQGGLDFNLEEFFGKTQVLDRLPSIPEIPDLKLPRISIPGGKNYGRPQLSRGHYGHHRRQRAIPIWTDIETLDPNGEEQGYLPDPIPDGGITITDKGADENCEVCKLAVTAVDTWLDENAPQLQKMISNAVLPFCQIFPSPMKEDCISDVSELVQTFIQTILNKLQPEPVCTWLRMCDAKEEEAVTPTIEAGMEPTTWPIIP